MTTSTALEKIEEWFGVAGTGHPRCTRLIRLAVEGLKAIKEDNDISSLYCDKCGHGTEMKDCDTSMIAEDTLEKISKEIEGK